MNCPVDASVCVVVFEPYEVLVPYSNQTETLAAPFRLVRLHPTVAVVPPMPVAAIVVTPGPFWMVTCPFVTVGLGMPPPF